MGSFYVETRCADLGDLITRAKGSTSNDSPEMNEIIRRFDNTAVSVAKTMTPDRHLREDLANAARLSVVAAVRSHTAGQPGFPSYAKAFMKGAAKRELKGWTATATVDMELNDDAMADVLFRATEALPPTADRTWGSVRMMQAVSATSSLHQETLQLRFVEDLSLAAIAATAGVSESAVSQRLTTALKVIERVLAA